MPGTDLLLPSGRRIRTYDTGPVGADELAVFWHGGSPNTGAPPEPLLGLAAELRIRFLGADRPGYGGSDRWPEARIADVVGDVAAVADAAGVRRFAVLGHSGGGPRALATAALLPDRVVGAVAVAAPAPVTATGFDRYAGMAPGVEREQRAVAAGRAALERVLAEGEFDPTSFTPGDHAALQGAWGWFMTVVQDATAHGEEGFADDLMAQAVPWGADLGAIRVPVRILHGDADRMVPVANGRWLAAAVPGAEAVIVAGAGHITALDAAPDALRWLRALAG